MTGEAPAEDVVARALARVRRAGADAADALLVESDSIEVRVRGEVIETVVQSRERTLGLRALVRGASGLRSAVTSTSDVSPAAVDAMADETVELARAAAEDASAGLPGEAPAADLPDLGLFDPADRDVGVEQLVAAARAAEAEARASDRRIRNSEGSQAASSFSQVTFADSRGFLGRYEAASHSLACEPVAQDESGMQRDWWLSLSRRRSALEEPAAVGRRAAQRAVRRLGGRRVATCEVPVIFDPVTAPSLLGHLVSCVSGYALYRGTSFLRDKLGERIASERVTVVDDGRLVGGLGSRPFDGEGQPTRRTAVVERGRLSSWLLDAYSGRKLGLPSTGNAARAPGSLPSVAPGNLWLTPGDASLEEIVADTRRGLLVTELIGMGFQPVSGNYSRGAAGLWIENGEIQHPVEEVTIAGHLGEMLACIDAVGRDLVWLGRTASPPLRVAKMTVAGE